MSEPVIPNVSPPVNPDTPQGQQPTAATGATATEQPLALTVHSLPSPDGAGDAPRRTVTGRLKMLLVLLVCAAPVVASYFTYYVLRPEGRRNFGELITPQRPIPLLAVQDLQGQVSNLQAQRGQWLLIAVGPAACAAMCQQYLYLQRQLRESLGREKDRLDRVWLVTDTGPLDPALQPALQGATVLRVPAAQLAQWLLPGTGHTLEEHLYLVDPLGNWMMRFPARLDVAGAAKAKRDVERVLRASSFWDKPGRGTQ